MCMRLCFLRSMAIFLGLLEYFYLQEQNKLRIPKKDGEEVRTVVMKSAELAEVRQCTAIIINKNSWALMYDTLHKFTKVHI